LCAGAPARGTEVRIRLEDRVGRSYLDYKVEVPAAQRHHEIDFDAPAGLYRLTATSTTPQCSDQRFVYFMDGYDRDMSMTLSSQPDTVPRPIYLFAGTVPRFVVPDVHPSPVAFDESAQCDYPVGKALPVGALTENEAGSYYITLYAEPGVRAGSQTLTFNVQQPPGTDHFVYVPTPFPIAVPSDGWPVVFRLDIPPPLLAALDPRTSSWMVCWHFHISSSK
jgi:hypothetical protein